MDDRYFVCILAGGSGERFWPLSRRALPKHLLNLFGETTLLEQAVRRVEQAVSRDRIVILTNEVQLEATRRLLPFLDPAQIVAEPAKRDTAPAAALATALARERHPDAVVALLPADALIHDGEAFSRQLAQAFAAAAEGKAFVTLAVHPVYPATGFGYLEVGGPTSVPGFLQVLRFVEKPDERTARDYLKTGRFGWNAGIFVWSVAFFLKEADHLQPALADFVREWPIGPGWEARFAALPKISVDYALMEKATAVWTAWADFDWDDVGTWTALPTHLGEDARNNTVRGAGIVVDGSYNIVVSSGRTVVLYGVDDLVVVESADAVLVCPRSKVQEVKNLQKELPPELL